MLHRSKRVFNIDPPASSNAMMQRPQTYCAENSEPGRRITESLTTNPRVREQPRLSADIPASLIGVRSSPDSVAELGCLTVLVWFGSDGL